MVMLKGMHCLGFGCEILIDIDNKNNIFGDSEPVLDIFFLVYFSVPYMYLNLSC